MKKIAYFASLVILAGLVVVACKKDDDSTPPTEENKHAITDLDPKEGPVGQEVVIIGTNFTDQNATAAIGGTAAVITGVNTDKTELYIEVPNGATDGKISVTIDGLRVESTQIFDVTETIAGPESIELAETDLAMRSLETISVPEITNIADFDNPMVQWESNTPETAVVDNDGNITALQAGEAQIEVSINSASGELNTTIEVTVEESILVVGSFDNGNYDVASLWLNEEQIVLGDETDYSNAASVNGRYVAGYEGNRACVWHIKNKGEINRIDLTADGVGYAEAKSVVNIGDDVIAAGFIYKDENENSMAVLWHISPQGEITTIELTDGGTYADSYGVVADDQGNKHVVGVEENLGGINVATYWSVNSNNAVSKLKLGPDLAQSIAYSIAIENDGTLDIGGEEFNGEESVATYTQIQNGAILDSEDLSNGQSYARASSINLLGDDVYIGGTYNKTSTIWINSSPISIGAQDGLFSYSNDSFPTDDALYMVGGFSCECPSNGAEMWVRNAQGSITTVELEGKEDSYLYSVYVL